MSCTIDPLYIKLAQLAYDTVLQTMLAGEKDHPGNEWAGKSADFHKYHALKHAESAYIGHTDEKHINNCLTRCTMAIFKEINP